MRDHRKLRVFQSAHALVLLTYCSTRDFPRTEIFGMVTQMRRCSISVAANIVEGCARKSEKEYLQFLNCSFGSLRELGYYIDLARELGYLDPAATAQLRLEQGRTASALTGLIRSLR